ncbi:MAG: lipoprotein [Aquabacterium sp.]|nr:lipoprotein [Aquabacterium sp.]
MNRNDQILGSTCPSGRPVRLSATKIPSKPARQLITTALSVALLGLSLAGCGQKGPLYLPAHTGASASTPSPAASK